MIVWVASYPRSGNTYFLMLLKHAYGIETYSIYDDPILKRMGAEEAVGHKRLPASIDVLSTSDELFFVKTHDCPVDQGPAIYVVRDGRDALVSYAHFRLSFDLPRSRWSALRRRFYNRAYANMLRTLIVGTTPYGGWSGNVHNWTVERSGGKSVLVRYEDLVQNPFETVSQSFAALDLELGLSTQTIPEFSELQSRWPHFFRKGAAGAWRTEMPPQLHTLFWQHHGATMDYLGYGPD